MDWKPTAKLKTYQDVKINLAWYTSVLLLVIFCLGSCLLFENTFIQWFKSFKDEWNNILGCSISMIVISFFVGWVLIFLFEIHDKIYDRYFIKWRHYYALDFLLPFLTMPIANRIDKSFFNNASQHLYDFMKPFYVFVGDGEGEKKIDKNLCLRFYENVMKYWITQINEIIVFSCLIAITVFTCKKMLSYEKLTFSYMTICLLFLINRFFIRSTRESTRQATIDEIEEIHEKFPKELDNEFRKLHKKFGMTYGES